MPAEEKQPTKYQNVRVFLKDDGFSTVDLWLSTGSRSGFWKCKLFSGMFSNAFASISLQNRADKKRLNIIIVAEGAIDCHNKAITPDYIKDVSMVEKPGLVMDPKTLPQKHNFFFGFIQSFFCPRCHFLYAFSHVIFKNVSLIKYPLPHLLIPQTSHHLEMFYSIPSVLLHH